MVSELVSRPASGGQSDDELAALDNLRLAVAKAGAGCLRSGNYRKLGHLERAILREVVERLLERPRRPLTDEVVWNRQHRSRNEAQAISRALRTLERRGLIVRYTTD